MSRHQTVSISGGEALVQAVAANGVDTVFGITGAQIYPMFGMQDNRPATLHRNLTTTAPFHTGAVP